MVLQSLQPLNSKHKGCASKGLEFRGALSRACSKNAVTLSCSCFITSACIAIHQYQSQAALIASHHSSSLEALRQVACIAAPSGALGFCHQYLRCVCLEATTSRGCTLPVHKYKRHHVSTYVSQQRSSIAHTSGLPLRVAAKNGTS